MSREEEIRRSRRQLGELLGLAPCPAAAPHLFEAVIASAPRARPVSVWRRPRFAVALTAAVLVAAVSFHIWRSGADNPELADIDELAAASLVL
jgi:hypothetical protein